MPQTRLVSVTDLTCPSGNGVDTHHLVPIHGSLVCTHCRRTELDIRNSTPVLHSATPCGCWSCSFTQVQRCAFCHLDMHVHSKQSR